MFVLPFGEGPSLCKVGCGKWSVIKITSSSSHFVTRSVFEISKLFCKVFSDAVELPEIHADPFDRIIIAEARARKIPVVTYDAVFSGYGVKTVS